MAVNCLVSEVNKSENYIFSKNYNIDSDNRVEDLNELPYGFKGYKFQVIEIFTEESDTSIGDIILWKYKTTKSSVTIEYSIKKTTKELIMNIPFETTKSKRSLKKDDLKKILNHKPKFVSEQKALDYWIFSFLCNGMNFKDIAFLTNKKINGDFIEFYRSKTENTTRDGALPIKVPISDRIKEIMERRRVSKGKPDDYMFPVLERGMDLELIEKRISTFIRNTNKALNDIGADLDLPLKLTTYVARHCFATIQKNNGAPLIYIKEALGHSNITTTQDYFGSFDDDSLKTMHEGLMEGMEG